MGRVRGCKDRKDVSEGVSEDVSEGVSRSVSGCSWRVTQPVSNEIVHRTNGSLVKKKLFDHLHHAAFLLCDHTSWKD